MDFFEHQDVARRKTGLLIAYFGLAVVLIIVSIYAVFMALFIGGTAGTDGIADAVAFWQPDIFLLIAAITVLVVGGGSLFKIAALAGGGENVALSLGGRPIDPNTRDRAERRVLNVVEEMAIASGTPVPPVFMLDEPGINAFAAGFHPADAVVAVTRGCVEQLSRDELQGVVAHEFSHILNGDMRINIRLMGVLHGILVIALIGNAVRYHAAFSSHRRRSNRDNSGMAVFLFGLALFAIGYIGMFFAKLIKSAVSRQREFLADASAVQFTRNPDGIAGALKKIGGYASGSRIRHTGAEEASHMFFANGIVSHLNAMATHPPLEERIRRIDPNFDGAYPEIAAVAGSEQARGFAAAPPAAAETPTGPPPLPRIAVSPEQAVAQIGAPEPRHLAYAHDLVAALPTALVEAVHEPFGARAIVYALLLNPATDSEKQLRQLEKTADAAVFKETRRVAPLTKAVPATARLPLIDMAVPALRSLSVGQYDAFRSNVARLVEADAEVSLFEYAIQRILIRHLDPGFGRKEPRSRPARSFADIVPDAVVLLATMAYFGQSDADAAAAAFSRGFGRLRTGMHRELPPVAECGLPAVDAALQRLRSAPPQMKKRVIDACAACGTADGEITVDEAELLRAVADSLGCPMPPLLSE